MSEAPLNIEGSELEIAYSGPAFVANRIYVTFGGVVRITFAEQSAPDATPHFRTAVGLNPQDAIELRNLLTRMLQPFEQMLATAVAQQSGAQVAD